MRSISYVMVEVKALAWAFATYIAKSAPPMPAKKLEMTNDIVLCLKRAIPIASAAISSSLIALNALPYEECIRSTITTMHNEVMRNGTKVESLKITLPEASVILKLENVGNPLIIFAPLVTGPSFCH